MAAVGDCEPSASCRWPWPRVERRARPWVPVFCCNSGVHERLARGWTIEPVGGPKGRSRGGPVYWRPESILPNPGVLPTPLTKSSQRSGTSGKGVARRGPAPRRRLELCPSSARPDSRVQSSPLMGQPHHSWCSAVLFGQRPPVVVPDPATRPVILVRLRLRAPALSGAHSPYMVSPNP